MITTANKKKRNIQFAVGDSVQLSTKHPWFRTLEGVKKLIPAWSGPFIVKKTLHRTPCVLELPDDIKTHNQFHSLLFKYYNPRTQVQTPQPPTRINGHNYFYVVLTQSLITETVDQETTSSKNTGYHSLIMDQNIRNGSRRQTWSGKRRQRNTAPDSGQTLKNEHQQVRTILTQWDLRKCRRKWQPTSSALLFCSAKPSLQNTRLDKSSNSNCP